MTTTLPDADLERRLGTVGEAMTGEVVLLEADTLADVAVRCLERTWVSGAPVIDRGRVVGVVTLGDLLPGSPPMPRPPVRSCVTTGTWSAYGSVT